MAVLNRGVFNRAVLKKGVFNRAVNLIDLEHATQCMVSSGMFGISVTTDFTTL